MRSNRTAGSAARRAGLARPVRRTLTILAGTALAGTAAGCSAPYGTHSAEDLAEALLVEFEDTQRLEEQTEAGIYRDLVAVQYAEDLRAGTELDKPECLEGAGGWGRLDAVRESPAALASYSGDGEAITHMLVAVDDDTADLALSMRPDDECHTYHATGPDGEAAEYRVRELDLEPVGEGSYASVVEAEVDEETVLLYSLIYRGSGHLGMTTVLGVEPDSEDTLRAFVEAAWEHERELLE